jgi:hypothetical protein
MSVYRIVIVQQASAPNAAQDAATRAEIRDQIRQSIEDARAAAVDARAAAQAATHTRVTVDRQGVIVTPPPPPTVPRFSIQDGGMDMIPPQVVDIANGFFFMCAVMVIGWPLARAFGRRLERRGEAPAVVDAAIAGQLQRIEQAVEAMSIEVERISESQRFMARLQTGAPAERAALGVSERR